VLSVRPEVVPSPDLAIQIVASVFREYGHDCTVTRADSEVFAISVGFFPEDCLQGFLDECQEMVGMGWRVERGGAGIPVFEGLDGSSKSTGSTGYCRECGCRCASREGGAKRRVGLSFSVEKSVGKATGLGDGPGFPG